MKKISICLRSSAKRPTRLMLRFENKLFLFFHSIAFLTRFPVEVYVYLSVLRVTTQNGPNPPGYNVYSLRSKRFLAKFV